MKTNNHSLTHSDDKPTTASVGCATRNRSSGLKLLLAITTVTAACLSYQAVNEAIGLHRLLDQCHEALSARLPTKVPAVAGSNISETKPRVAGL